MSTIEKFLAHGLFLRRYNVFQFTVGYYHGSATTKSAKYSENFSFYQSLKSFFADYFEEKICWIQSETDGVTDKILNIEIARNSIFPRRRP